MNTGVSTPVRSSSPVFSSKRTTRIFYTQDLVFKVQDGLELLCLLAECKDFQAKVESGEAKPGQKKVDIVPPDPMGELGSGWEKMAAERIKGATDLTIGRT